MPHGIHQCTAHVQDFGAGPSRVGGHKSARTTLSSSDGDDPDGGEGHAGGQENAGDTGNLLALQAAEEPVGVDAGPPPDRCANPCLW